MSLSFGAIFYGYLQELKLESLYKKALFDEIIRIILEFCFFPIVDLLPVHFDK